MALWLALAIFAQFLFAVSTLVDKHVVVKATHIGKPIVYTFFTALLSGAVAVLAFTGHVSFPSDYILFLALINAVTFTISLYQLYSALAIARASDVAPVIGGISAIVTFVLAGLWIDGDVQPSLIPSILLLALGTLIISRFNFNRRALMLTFGAGLTFGLTAFLGKLIFVQTTFIDGFFWMRMMNVVVALSLLSIPALRSEIFKGGRKSSSRAKALIIGNKVVAGIGSVLTALAVSIGSVSLVNALAGLQFVFLFIFSLLFAGRMPKMESSATHGHGGWHTFLGVFLILCGLAFPYLI